MTERVFVKINGERHHLWRAALRALEQRQADQRATAAVLMADRNILDRDPNAPVIGSPDGEVTTVEFFDVSIR